MTEIIIIDYGAGNLRSVQKAFEHLGHQARITSDPADLAAAHALVMPGVGASGAAMEGLRRHGLVGPVREAIARGVPFFGVCLGLQLLMDVSEEGGETPCLGVVPGRVRRLPSGLKVPHMGWNRVALREEHPVFRDVPPGSYFYFVHSYYADPEDKALVMGTTEYGVSFCSALAQGSLIATQFHPEKSGALGLRLYDNFVRHMVMAGAA
ncbi:MAG: imidazole glycerol phosphate synthase subunit HisH [Chloroflexi bacterium]|nr:imidazole glycerol phosphate synthase subunit HisH [Chloroflexota bacterium]